MMGDHGSEILIVRGKHSVVVAGNILHLEAIHKRSPHFYRVIREIQGPSSPDKSYSAAIGIGFVNANGHSRRFSHLLHSRCEIGFYEALPFSAVKIIQGLA